MKMPNGAFKQSTIRSDEYVSRETALEILSVKPQTLYAYVSRGWIRSVQQPGGGKRSLYARVDVEKMKSRSGVRQGHQLVAANAMRWGEPIIPTAITEITADGPYYRGKHAITLARSGASYESVSEWLWSGLWLDQVAAWPVEEMPAHIAGLFDARRSGPLNEHLIWRFALLSLHVGATRGKLIEGGWAPDAPRAARQMIQAMVGCIGTLGPSRKFNPVRPGESVSRALLRVLGAPINDANVRAMESILILAADHELTGSTFAARVAASSGALLHACLNAALATHSGIEIGRLCDRAENFLMLSAKADALFQQARDKQRSGVTPPGFNHPLYPRGDPRADHLIEIAAALPNKPPRLKGVLKFLEDARTSMHLFPRAELGIAVVAMALRLPPGASAGLFTIARTAGWVAHTLEQRTSGYMLRPRARFISKI